MNVNGKLHTVLSILIWQGCTCTCTEMQVNTGSNHIQDNTFQSLLTINTDTFKEANKNLKKPQTVTLLLKLLFIVQAVNTHRITNVVLCKHILHIHALLYMKRLWRFGYHVQRKTQQMPVEQN